MKSNEIKKIRDGIYAQIQTDKQSLIAVTGERVAKLSSDDADLVRDTYAGLLTSVQNVIKAAYVDDVSLPECLVKFLPKVEDGKTTAFVLSIRSKLRAGYKVKEEYTIVNDADVVNSTFDAFVKALYIMLDIELAQKNIVVLNERVAKLCADAEIPCMLSFACDTEAGIIVAIDNDMVVFNVGVDAAHGIMDLGLFSEGSEYNNLIREEAEKALIDSLKAAQTTTQLIKADVKLVKAIVDITTKKRASKIIRIAYHKNAKFLDKQKSGVGYFDETVTINGEEVKVFALVEKTEDGAMKVVLNPFDVATNMNVDFDVIGALK